MKSQRKRKLPAKSSSLRRTVALFSLAAIVVACAVAFVAMRQSRQQNDRYVLRARGELTFNTHIAPIVFRHCADCHRSGQSAPFPLLTYADVKKRAADIAAVTASRYMPPWLAEHRPGEFMDERRLSPQEIGMIQQWVAEGSIEGRSSDLPATPTWSSDWQLGPPDLVVKMAEPFALAADGRDVYRNFLLPVPLDRPRYIRALEFRTPSKAVHHAFIRFDRTGECRRLDERDPGPGFGGMDTPPTAETPAGYFSSWAPGARPCRSPDGLAWQLPANADLVVLMHMQPRGKPELVEASVGLYFTDAPPTNTAVKVNLRTFAIDIPAGATNYTVEESFTLPVDTDLLAIKPHAHYLGRRLEGIASLPDGTTKTLLRIPQWDFNWQTDYRYTRPVSLPAGTTLRLRYTYDNSTNNPHNPHHPPARVKYGLETTDEMAELAFQMLARRRSDLAALQAAVEQYGVRDMLALNELRLRENPADAESAAEIGKILFAQRNMAGAEAMLRRAVRLRPDSADIHYSLGVLFMEQSAFDEAEMEFATAARLNPEHYKARNNAGICCLRQGKLDDAAIHFREALRIRPNDTFAQNNLQLVAQARREQLKRP